MKHAYALLVRPAQLHAIQHLQGIEQFSVHGYEQDLRLLVTKKSTSLILTILFLQFDLVPGTRFRLGLSAADFDPHALMIS
jgi:hypothetical protein